MKSCAADDVPALGVGHGHQRDCQVARTDSPGLAFEPLVLGQADELLGCFVWGQGEHAIDVTGMHESTVTFFQ